MSLPALIIPIRFNPAGAAQQANAVGAAGAAAGQRAAAGMNTASAAAEEFGESALGAQMVVGGMAAIVTGVMKSVGEDFREAAEYCANLGREFAALRASMQEVAALKGKPGSNNTTLEEAASAAQAGLKPGEWAAFQKQFQSYGGAFIEGPQNRFKDNAGGSAEQQAQSFQERAAAFSKSRGNEAGDVAQLAGGLLQFAEGTQTPDTLMAQLGRVDKVLERATTPKKQLQHQMTPLMATGSTAEEAAGLLNIFSDIKPGSEGHYAQGANTELMKLLDKGQGDEYGIKKGMSPYERMKAFATNMAARDLSDNELDEELTKISHRMEHRAALKGLVKVGIGQDKFAMVEGYVNDTPDDYARKSVADYKKTAQGAAEDRAARAALKDVEIGSKEQAKMALKEEAEIGIKEELARPQGLLGYTLTKAGEAFGQGDHETQLVRAEASRVLLRNLEESPDPRAAEFLDGKARGDVSGIEGRGPERRVMLREHPRAVQNEEILTQGANLYAQIMRDVAKNTKATADAARPKALVPVRPPGQAGRGGG